jgi:hypothetical protein
VLGVRPGAGRREVTDAYRRFALRHHPDRGGDPFRFQAGADAYHRLIGAPSPRPLSSGADVVFHRRRSPGVHMLLRMAGRRFGALRSRLR